MTVYNDLDEEILDDLLSEEDLAALESMDKPKPATSTAPTIPDDDSYKPVPVKIVAATDEELETLTNDILLSYPEILESISGNWRLNLIAILQTTDYQPRRGMIANSRTFKGIDRVGHIGYADGHISNLALNDIREYIDIWTKEHPIQPRPKVDIINTESGGLAYQATTTTVEKSESATQEGWASW